MPENTPTSKFNDMAETGVSPAVTQAYQEALVEGRVKTYHAEDGSYHAVIVTDKSHEVDKNGVVTNKDGETVPPLDLRAINQTAVPQESEVQDVASEKTTQPVDPELEKFHQALDEGRVRLIKGRHGHMRVKIDTPEEHKRRMMVKAVQDFADPHHKREGVHDQVWGDATAHALQDKLEAIQKKNHLPETGVFDGSKEMKEALLKEKGGATVLAALETLQKEGTLEKRTSPVDVVQHWVAPGTTNKDLKDGDWGTATSDALHKKIEEVQERNHLEKTGIYDGGAELKKALKQELGEEGGKSVISALDKLKAAGKLEKPEDVVEMVDMTGFKKEKTGRSQV